MRRVGLVGDIHIRTDDLPVLLSWNNNRLIDLAIEIIKLKMIIYSRLKKDQAAIMKTIDISLFHKIRKKHVKIAPRANYTKYLSIGEYLPRNLKRAYRLGIHKSKPLNILDIGAGAGYFCFVCNYFGHNVMGMDVGKSLVFDELIQLLGINRKIGAIEAFKKLPKFDTDFDLITAFYVPFNRASNPDEVWKVEEWKFLLEDLANNLLKKNGRILFFLHHENDGKYYDKILLQFFLDYDDRLLGQELYFEDTEKLRLLSRA